MAFASRRLADLAASLSKRPFCLDHFLFPMWSLFSQPHLQQLQNMQPPHPDAVRQTGEPPTPPPAASETEPASARVSAFAAGSGKASAGASGGLPQLTGASGGDGPPKLPPLQVS